MLKSKSSFRKGTAYVSKKPWFFKWWFAVLVIVLIAGVGIIIVRFSNAAEPGVVAARYKGFDGTYDLYSQISQGTELPVHRYKAIGNNTWGTADTAPGAARCYRIQPGMKYGSVTMTEVPTENCGYIWYVNRPTLQWPTDGGALTQCWGNSALEGVNITNPSWAVASAKHPGIDIGVGVGTPALAVDNGEIVAQYSEGQTGGYGKLLILKLDNGLYAGYAHLNDFKDLYGNQLAVGSRVGKGWVIAHTGNTGNVPAHLHFMIQNTPSITNGGNVPAQNLNPLNYFADNGWHDIGQCVRT